MDVVILIVLLLNLAVLAVLVSFALRIRKHNIELADLVAASALRAARPPEMSSTTVRGRLITIEILNPVELARTQNRFSGFAGAVAPDLLRRVVYDKAAQIVREQLVEQGVDAEVKIHVGGR